MTWFHVAQLALGAVALTLVAKRAWVLMRVAPIDQDPFLKVVRELKSQDPNRLRQLAAALHPAWPAQILSAATASRQADAARSDVEETAIDFGAEAFRHLRLIRGLATISSVFALLAIIVEYTQMLRGVPDPILGQAIVAETTDRALLSMIIGIMVSVFVFSALPLLKKHAVKRLKEVERCRTELAC